MKIHHLVLFCMNFRVLFSLVLLLASRQIKMAKRNISCRMLDGSVVVKVVVAIAAFALIIRANKIFLLSN